MMSSINESLFSVRGFEKQTQVILSYRALQIMKNKAG